MTKAPIPRWSIASRMKASYRSKRRRYDWPSCKWTSQTTRFIAALAIIRICSCLPCSIFAMNFCKRTGSGSPSVTLVHLTNWLFCCGINLPHLPRALQEINNGMHRTLSRHMHFGVSPDGQYPADIPELYARCSSALHQRDLTVLNHFIHDTEAPIGR